MKRRSLLKIFNPRASLVVLNLTQIGTGVLKLAVRLIGCFHRPFKITRIGAGILFLSILLLGGCATSRYQEAEKLIANREFNAALRSYMKLLNPKRRGNRRFIAYDREALTGISAVYWHLQRYEQTVTILDKVLQRDPFYGKALFYKGIAMEGMGNEDGALAQYSRYRVVDPSDRYRQVLFSRNDWIVRRKIAREVGRALQEEARLGTSTIPEKSIAVLHFMSLSEDSRWAPLRKGLADMMITDLSQVEDLKVVERLRLNYLLEELNLAESDLTETASSPRFGRLLGVRHMVKGSFLVLPDLKMTLDAGVFESQNPVLPEMANLEGTLSRLFQMEKELVLRILDGLGIELSLQQRDRILKIPTENMEAFLEYCRGLDSIDSYDYDTAYRYFQNALSMDPNFTMAGDRLMSQSMWEATHHSNLIRVDREVAAFMKVRLKDKRDEYEAEFVKTTAWNRLQWMGMYQNIGFIPGTETRESFQEADMMGAPVLPILLNVPPAPPTRGQ